MNCERNGISEEPSAGPGSDREEDSEGSLEAAGEGRNRTRGEILRDHIEEFRSNLRALSSFVDNVEPVISSQMDVTYEEHVRKLAAYGLLMDALVSGRSGDSVSIDSFGWRVTVVPTEDENHENSFSLEGEPDAVESFMAAVNDLASNPAKRREALKRASHVPRQQELLYETSLISLVSIVEWFYSQLMSDLYRWFPDRLNTKEACFSLQDLKGFDTVADAVEQMIEDRVTKHVHESVDAWIDDLVKWFGIGPEAHAVLKRGQIVEVVRRRDVFVHNGGCVSRLYLARVGREAPELVEGIDKGQRLSVTSEYLDESIELLETAFVSLALGIWGKAATDDPGFRAAYLLDLSFDALCEDKYVLAAYVGDYVAADQSAPEWERRAARVNGWLADKYRNGLASVEAQVEAFDVTALAEEFKIAKAALLDQHELLVSGLPDLLDRRGIEPAQLRDWPLHKTLRESDYWPEVERICAAFEQEQEDLKESIDVTDALDDDYSSAASA